MFRSVLQFMIQRLAFRHRDGAILISNVVCMSVQMQVASLTSAHTHTCRVAYAQKGTHGCIETHTNAKTYIHIYYVHEYARTYIHTSRQAGRQTDRQIYKYIYIQRQH